MRAKILKYIKPDQYFDVMLDGLLHHDNNDEIRVDAWTLGHAFFPDENYIVTDEDYHSMVGKEFEFERWQMKVFTYTVRNSEDIQVVPKDHNKWIIYPELCAQCGSEYCDCGSYRTYAEQEVLDEEYRIAREAERIAHEEATREERERANDDRLLKEFKESMAKVRKRA
jgi:hypothetical protein